MFDWLRRLLKSSEVDERQKFNDFIDDLNTQSHGGVPKTTRKFLGRLHLRSPKLLIAEPMFLNGLEITGFQSQQVAIFGMLKKYPSGHEGVAGLKLVFSDAEDKLEERSLGNLGIDSGRIVILDEADTHEHWTERGKDRLGVLLMDYKKPFLYELIEKFQLKTRLIHPMRTEIVDSVSEELEQAIISYLKQFPEYAQITYAHFTVQTNNSFERVNFMDREWQFMPVGNISEPLMFACETGVGDGSYEAIGYYAGDLLQSIAITFIKE